MKPQALTPFILFSLAAVLPACQGVDPGAVGASYGAQVAPPASCGTGDPTCNVALDYPTQADLTTEKFPKHRIRHRHQPNTAGARKREHRRHRRRRGSRSGRRLPRPRLAASLRWRC